MEFAYYPGCSLNATGLEFDRSVKAVAEKLDLQLHEIPEWNCCGATAAHLSNPDLALALPARNLALAEQAGLDMDVAVPCAACFSRMKTAVHEARASEETKAKIEDILEMPYEAKHDVFNMLDVLANKVPAEEIKSKVVKPLKGLKVACYYGCLLVRPNEITKFDDVENPMTMDRMMELIGAEPVDWSFKTDCCGASLGASKKELGLEMLYKILRNAETNGAEAFACACPLCMLNLDMRQKAVNKKFGTSFSFPVYYFSELMAAAMGTDPKAVAMDKHFVPAIELLEKKMNNTGGEEA